MSSRRRRFGVIIWEAAQKVIPHGHAFVFDSGKGLLGGYGTTQSSDVSREDLIKLYREDPLAKQAIDMQVFDSVGGGFFTDVKGDEISKEIVDKFAAKVNLDYLIWLFTRDMLATGDGIFERIYSHERLETVTIEVGGRTERVEMIVPVKGAKFAGLKWVPSWSMEVKMEPTGAVKYWVQKSKFGKEIRFHPDKIIRTPWNPTGLDAYGTSELHAVYGLLEDLKEIRENFVKIIKRYAAPPIIWQCNGMSREEILALKERNEGREPGEDCYLNTDLVKAEVLEIDARGKFDNYYKTLQDAAIIGLETPTLTLVAAEGAKWVLEFYKKKVEQIRRVIKRMIEREIFKPLIMQDSKATEVPRVRWNQFYANYELVLDLFDRGIYSHYQAEQVMKVWGIPFPPEPEDRMVRKGQVSIPGQSQGQDQGQGQSEPVVQPQEEPEEPQDGNIHSKGDVDNED